MIRALGSNPEDEAPQKKPANAVLKGSDVPFASKRVEERYGFVSPSGNRYRAVTPEKSDKPTT
jgi:hypothetical protein